MIFRPFARLIEPVVGLFLLLYGFGVVAQTPPQAGSVLKELERNLVITPAPPPKPALAVPDELRDLADSKTKIAVHDFRITGATLIPAEELREEVKEFVGSEMAISELRKAALRVSDAYRRRGLFARALLPQQRIQNGVVEIAVIEGRLSAIDVDVFPGAAISSELARGYVEAQQRLGAPLHPEAVQDGLRNLNDLPGVSAMGVLQPGEADGEVKLRLRLDSTPPANGSIYIDNFGLKSTGVSRAVGYGQFNSPTGNGDQATLLAVGTSGSNYLRAGYSVPLGYDGMRLGATAARLNYKLSGNFSGFSGYANILGATLTQPLRRTAYANVFGSLAYENKHFVNDAAGGINMSDKKSDTFTLAVSGDFLDGNGRNAFNLSLVSGRIDLGGNASDLAADSATARAQGDYTKIAWFYNRLQSLTEGTDLYFGFTGQAAEKNLDSFEKLSLGGANGVRAFPGGEALGDEGWIANLELRQAFLSDFQGSVFVDVGHIRVLHSPYDGWNSGNLTKPNNYGLQGIGFGLQYTRVNSFAIRSSIARKLGSNPGRDANGNDVDGGHGKARAWIQFILFM